MNEYEGKKRDISLGQDDIVYYLENPWEKLKNQ